MSQAFLQALLDEARRDPRVFLINPDTVGYYCEPYRRELPNQYLNAGIAEQNAVGVAAGMAISGRRPCIFNILAFNSFRCYEQVRLDVCAMNLGVVLAGLGAGIDYGAFGPSHQATEDLALMRALPGMAIWSPADAAVAAALVRHCVQAGGPAYLRLHRTDEFQAYPPGALPDLNHGLALLRPGRHLLLAATGPMVPRALEVATALSACSIDAAVVDVFRLKPFPQRRFLELAAALPRIVTLEEHFVSGGLGSAVLEALADSRAQKPVQRFGLPDRFCRACGDRAYLHAVSGLDAATLVAGILNGGVQ